MQGRRGYWVNRCWHSIGDPVVPAVLLVAPSLAIALKWQFYQALIVGVSSWALAYCTDNSNEALALLKTRSTVLSLLMSGLAGPRSLAVPSLRTLGL